MTEDVSAMQLPFRRARRQQIIRPTLFGSMRYLGRPIDFRAPAGEPALSSADSVAWRIFKNPVTLFIGGMSAVVLELAEPRVRDGVWNHTSFKRDPVTRMRRTGLAAMITVYAARSVAEDVIGRIGRMHANVKGTTRSGLTYRADDPQLLTWVQVTASAQFLAAYHRFAGEVSPADRDRFFRDAGPSATLYGAAPAQSEADAAALYDAMLPLLEPSPVLAEYFAIIKQAPALPWPLKGLQGPAIRAATAILPTPIRDKLGLSNTLTADDTRKLQRAARLAERFAIPLSPPVQACKRLGLPGDYLHKQAQPRTIA
ncbi:MAG: oxygenase MpaB family protein [Pseudomonadota bacterium]